MTRQIRIVDAPSNLGLKSPEPGREPGTRHAPKALRAQNLLARLSAQDGGLVEAPPYSPDAAGVHGVRNARTIAQYSLQLATHVGRGLNGGEFPLVLGGDCSILLGSLLALRERGRYGLFFVDGHRDLLTPEISATGGAAGMDLALALGRGPELLTDLKGFGPLLAEEHTVVFGFRDYDQPYNDQQVEGALFIDLATATEQGIEHSVTSALEWLEIKELDGVWLHCDVNVLNSDIMPAVDSPQPGGFSYEELTKVLHLVLSHSLCIGMQFTIFDPGLDPQGDYARELGTLIVNAFQDAGVAANST